MIGNRKNGQAMIETVILIPVFLLLVLGIMHFGLRMMNQARCAMALRYALWCGTHGKYDDMEKQVYTQFFPYGGASNAWYELNISKSHVPTASGIAIVDTLLKILPGSMTKENVKVGMLYTQKQLPFAAPGAGTEASFIWGSVVSNYPLSGISIDTNNWNRLNDLIKHLF